MVINWFKREKTFFQIDPTALFVHSHLLFLTDYTWPAADIAHQALKAPTTNG